MHLHAGVNNSDKRETAAKPKEGSKSVRTSVSFSHELYETLERMVKGKKSRWPGSCATREKNASQSNGHYSAQKGEIRNGTKAGGETSSAGAARVGAVRG